MNTIEIQLEIQNQISNLIRELLIEEHHILSIQEYDFIVLSLSHFTFSAIAKYIKGSKEHGGTFLHDRNHKQELYHELIDGFWYNAADRYNEKV